MTTISKVWVGADPGGKTDRAFGIAVLVDKRLARVGRVRSVAEAIELVCRVAVDEPFGLGVDAPLWWSAGPGGDRCADRRLRAKYKDHIGSTIQTANSLQGAAVVQGVLLVSQLRARFPHMKVTESHPKALLKGWLWDHKDPWRWFWRHHLVGEFPARLNKHKRDAVIAAVSAREGFENRWKMDLSTKRCEEEQVPRGKYWLGSVHYWWPEEVR